MNSMYRFQNKLKFVKGKINNWKKEEFRNILREKSLLEDNLGRLQNKGMREGFSPSLLIEERRIQAQLEEREKQ